MGLVPAAGGAFKTALPGTPEHHWAALETRAWAPLAGPLIVVAPHPDDETLGAGGLIHTWAAIRGLPVVIVSVTDGEAACPEVAGLAAVRRGELDAACHELSTAGIDIVRLQLPDGSVRLYQEELAIALHDITGSLPHATIVAPFEQDGHPDHDVAGEVATQVARSQRVPLARYPIWAWHQGTPPIFSGSDMGSFALSPAAQRAKEDAIRRFQSQIGDRPGGAIVPAHVLRYFARPYEIFVL